MIRALDPVADRAAVADLFARVADYVMLERGTPPGEALVEEFFTDAPPGLDPATSLRLGLFEAGRLVAIADLAFGFPARGDAFLGLLLVDAARRGSGIGGTFLRHIEEAARARRASRLLLAVLDDNIRGRAFWDRAGFRVVLTAPPARIGDRLHVRHRMEKPL